MPTYAYRCPECGHEFDKVLRISQYKDPQTCPECGHNPAKKLITPVNFNLPGDDFTGKNIRIRNQMRKKNERLDRKQEERKRDAPGVRLAPNVGGERTESWSEAAKLAASQGKNTAGYEKMARKEKTLKSKPTAD